MTVKILKTSTTRHPFPIWYVKIDERVPFQNIVSNNDPRRIRISRTDFSFTAAVGSLASYHRSLYYLPLSREGSDHFDGIDNALRLVEGMSTYFPGRNIRIYADKLDSLTAYFHDLGIVGRQTSLLSYDLIADAVKAENPEIGFYSGEGRVFTFFQSSGKL